VNILFELETAALFQKLGGIPVHLGHSARSQLEFNGIPVVIANANGFRTPKAFGRKP